jgi:prolyl-tRNA editing enzyme YbaK/EbsC (Cys-tRNA(Pro) deacylase)
MAASQKWGIASSALTGKIVDPDTFAMRFLMELASPLDSWKVRFFRSEVSHLAPFVLGSPFVGETESPHEFRAWASQSFDTVSQVDADAIGLLPHEVQASLSRIAGWKLYLHEPVSTMESVWEILGIPTKKMLNTQVFQTEQTQNIVFSAVSGDRRVDRKKVALAVGEHCKRLSEQDLVALKLRRGAISPLTATDGAVVILDAHLDQDQGYFMGSGHQNVSIFLDLHHIKHLTPVRVAEISQETS